MKKVSRKKVEAQVKQAVKAGRAAAERLMRAGDETLTKLGDAARRRSRARKTKSVLKGVGKAVLLTGVVVAAGTAARRRLRGR
jgi:hypothetical protein